MQPAQQAGPSARRRPVPLQLTGFVKLEQARCLVIQQIVFKIDVKQMVQRSPNARRLIAQQGLARAVACHAEVEHVDSFLPSLLPPPEVQQVVQRFGEGVLRRHMHVFRIGVPKEGDVDRGLKVGDAEVAVLAKA